MLFKLFSKIFSQEIKRLEEHNRIVGYREKQKENDITKDVIRDCQLEDAIGKKAIFIPNEWTDPGFYIVTGIVTICKDDKPVHEVFDVINNVKGFCLPGTIYLADEKMVKAILKLNPFERWNLSAGKSYMSNMWEKSYPNDDSMVTPSDILENKLKGVGFI